MPAWKIIVLVIVWAFSIFYALCIGWATDVLTSPEPHPDDGDGWLIRPIKHAICGALHGHKWKPATPEAGGWKGMRCARCGKTKIVRVVKKEVSGDA